MLENIELAKRVRDHVVLHPEQHNQKVWGAKDWCGTEACLAGWTVLLGGEPEWETLEAPTAAISVLVGAPYQARELLGLTRYEADLLFCARVHGEDAEQGAVKELDRLIAEAEQAAAERDSAGVGDD